MEGTEETTHLDFPNLQELVSATLKFFSCCFSVQCYILFVKHWQWG